MSRDDLPLGGYAILLALYEGGLWSLVRALERRGRALPERPPLVDVALVGVATHKVSRILTRERVTRPLRAPFTAVESPPGQRLHERARGGGLRRAVGQLLLCPYCAGAWVAAAFHLGLVWRPREARLLAGLFSSLAIADFLHASFTAMQR